MIPSLYYRYYGHIVGPAAIASAFRQRVEADGGTFEAEECLKDRIDALGPFYSQASLVMLPHGVNANKLYSIKPVNGTGDFAFTRSGTRTRKASTYLETVATGVPALDYTSDSTCPALSLEKASTNLLLQSESFDNASWGKFRASVTANTTAGPDNLSTADSFLETTDNNSHVVNQSVSKAASSLQYTLTIYVKPNGRDWIQIGLDDNTNGVNRFFNVATGAIGTAGSFGAGFTLNNSNITAMPNGFYRCEITATSTTATSIIARLVTSTDGATTVYIGDITKGLYVTGAQLEQGSYATSYIPTTTATVSRVADAVTALTGVSDLIGQTEGTLYFEGRSFADGTYKQISLSDGTASNRVSLSFNNLNQIHCHIFSGGTAQTSIVNAGFITGTTYKIAIVYRSNYVALFVDGVKVAEDLTMTPPVAMSQLKFNDGGSGSIFYGEGEELMLMKTALSDADAVSLTTP
jgi:hypothetical protein